MCSILTELTPHDHRPSTTDVEYCGRKTGRVGPVVVRGDVVVAGAGIAGLRDDDGKVEQEHGNDETGAEVVSPGLLGRQDQEGQEEQAKRDDADDVQPLRSSDELENV